MTEWITLSVQEKARLEERARRSSMEKSYLQLVINLIQKMSALPGLDNVVGSMLRSVAEVIGGTNVLLYYWIDKELYCADAFDRHERIDEITDSLVRQAMDTREAVEIEHDFDDTRMTTARFGSGYTWAYPLLVQTDLIGIIKMENLHIGMEDLCRHLPAFFSYAAIVLKNEILGQSRLQRAHDKLSQEVAARKEAQEALHLANMALETKVSERTAELQASNRQLLLDIAERKRIEETLRINEENLQSLFDAVHESVVLLDREGTILASNETFAARLDHSVEDCLGKSIYSLVPAETGESRRPIVAQAIETGNPVVFEDCRQGVWLHHSICPIMNQEGVVDRLAIYAMDITARKWSENTLRLQHDLVVALGGTVNIERCFSLCLKTALGLSGMDSGGIYSVDPENGKLHLAWSEGFSERFLQQVAEYDSDAQNAQIVRDGEPVYLDYAQIAPVPYISEEGLRSVAIIPVLHEGRAVACINLASRTVDEVSDIVRPILEAIAAQAGGFIARALLHAQLQNSENRFRALFEKHSAVQMLIDPISTTILDANQAAVDFYGYSVEHLRGMPISEINILPADTIREKLTDVLSTQSSNYLFRHQLADGTIRDVDVYVCPINISGRIVVQSIVHDVTERKLAEEELRVTQDYLQNLLDYANAPIIVWAPDFKITRFNHAFERFSGYSAEEVIGQRLEMLFPENERAGALFRIMDTLEGEYWESVEIPILRKDGTVRVALWNSANLHASDGHTLVATIAQGQDITDRKEAEYRLRESEGRLRTITESVTDAIIVTDERGCITYWNPAAEVIFGHDRDSVLGKDTHTLLAPEKYKRIYARAFSEYVPTGRGNAVGRMIELTALRKNGEEFPIELSLSAILVKECWHSIAVIRDITERKRAEAERGKLQAQLNQAQKMEAIGQLAGGVAHDFNNLLQVIQGYSEAIQMSKEEGTREWQEIAEVLSASERASQLTRQLLAFSRRQVIEPVVTDLNILIKDVLRMLRRVIGEHIEISFLPCTGLGTIFVDKGQMEQVMMNLCVNARDAMARGGRITIVTENVVLDGEFCTLNSWAIPGQFARVSVADTGHGMDAEICARIFEPFFTTKELGRGTGLGLATVYGIVRQHNGLINVESEVGKGTRFGVYIPIHQNSVTVAAATELPPAPGGKETILIAEDEPSVMNLLAMILRNAGYNVLMSANGGEAVEVFDKNADTIDLVLLDVMMPVLSGKEAMDVIKARQKDVAFLFSSGYSESAIHKDFVIQEGLTLIQKPYRRNDILREVRRILDDRAANRKSRD